EGTMHRLTVLLPCILTAALAAPAPAPRPWLSGWDRPLDPLGGCRFDRKGETLTVTVPGEGRDLETADGRPNAPRLLRVVEGDFTAQVRVRGDFGKVGLGGLRRAGLLLSDGHWFVSLTRAGPGRYPLHVCFSDSGERSQATVFLLGKRLGKG